MERGEECTDRGANPPLDFVLLQLIRKDYNRSTVILWIDGQILGEVALDFLFACIILLVSPLELWI